jgi:hypothetical protein
MSISPSERKEWPLDGARAFYERLLERALASIPEGGAAMVLGPMFILRTPEENFARFTAAQQKLSTQGITVFDQLPLVDYNLPEAPFNYALKFEIFYKGLITSGKITDCYLLSDWEASEGTKTEVQFCEDAGVPVHKGLLG